MGGKLVFLTIFLLLLLSIGAHADDSASLDPAKCTEELNKIAGKKPLLVQISQKQYVKYKPLLDRLGIQFDALDNSHCVYVTNYGTVQDIPFGDLKASTLLDAVQTNLSPKPETVSKLAQLPLIYEDTVWVSDVAYDVEGSLQENLETKSSIDPDEMKKELPNYTVAKTFADTYSGFKGIAVDSKDKNGTPYRIYGIAGTEVFGHRDLRTWASGLSFGKMQMTSDSAMDMVSDVADYLKANPNAEVIITGQSQGGLVGQGIAFLAKSLAQARGLNQPIHLVSWGAIGGADAIGQIVDFDRKNNRRPLNSKFVNHWKALYPEKEKQRENTWNEIASTWRNDPKKSASDVVNSVYSSMPASAYYFPIDRFTHLGTFPGRLYQLPTELALPKPCELLRLQETGLRHFASKKVAFELENHFLLGYERALKRGALAFNKETGRPKQWTWVSNIQSDMDGMAYDWADTIYEDTLARSKWNWDQCYAAGVYSTRIATNCTPKDDSDACQKTYTRPGSSILNRNYCLIQAKNSAQ